MTDFKERVLLTRLFDLSNDVNKHRILFTVFTSRRRGGMPRKKSLEVQEEKVYDLYRWTGVPVWIEISTIGK